MTLEDRLVDVILTGAPFTADDVTDAGRLAVDADHAPNGAQSAIGAQFNRWHRQGLIEPTGQVVRSAAPHRKGGAIRVWVATDRGHHWALRYRQDHLFE